MESVALASEIASANRQFWYALTMGATLMFPFVVLAFVLGLRCADQDDFPGDPPDPYSKPFLGDTREVPHA